VLLPVASVPFSSITNRITARDGRAARQGNQGQWMCAVLHDGLSCQSPDHLLLPGVSAEIDIPLATYPAAWQW
jgi:hypothetical protein